MIQTHDIADNVEVELYDVNELREQIPEWDDLGTHEKLAAMRQGPAPVHRISNHNVVVEPYREHLAELANPEFSTEAVDFTYMAFGDDETEPDPSDEHLKNEVYRDEIDDHVNDDEDPIYRATLLIGSDEAVGLDLIEAALVTEADEEDSDDMAANRVILDDEEERLQPKDSDHAVTVRIELSYKDASEV